MTDDRRATIGAQASLIALGALTVGMADAVLIAARRLRAAGAIEYVPQRLWTAAPLCWLVVAIVFALLVCPFARRRGGVWTTIGLLALFGAVRLQEQPPQLVVAGCTALVIAAGMVWFAGSKIRGPRPAAAGAIVTAWMAVIVVPLLMGDTDRRPPDSPATASPDVIVVFLDTVPYDSIFPGGSVRAGLPFFSKMAANGVVFHRAYSSSPWTLPAHFSAVTGLPSHKLGVSFEDQHYDRSNATLAERFRRRGYRTVAVLSNSFLNRGTGFARGFDVFEQAPNALDVCRTAPGTLLNRWWPWFAAGMCNWTASAVTRRAIEHVPAVQQPLFLLLNFMDAHDPYYVESDCTRPAGANPYPREVPAGEYRRRYHGSHVAAVRCIDAQLLKLEAELARRRREAIFVVLADHGEHFGEHGLVRHGNSLYGSLLHVPFMIRAPHLTQRDVTEPVSTASLSPLLLDVVEGRQPAPPVGGVVSSLLPPASLRQEAQWSIVAGPWHLIQRGSERALYDVVADPAERRDLSTHPGALPVLRKLSTDLERERSSRVDSREGHFRSLGYVR